MTNGLSERSAGSLKLGKERAQFMREWTLGAMHSYLQRPCLAGVKTLYHKLCQRDKNLCLSHVTRAIGDRNIGTDGIFQQCAN